MFRLISRLLLVFDYLMRFFQAGFGRLFFYPFGAVTVRAAAMSCVASKLFLHIVFFIFVNNSYQRPASWLALLVHLFQVNASGNI